MSIIELFYTLSVVLALSAAVPQIKKLLKIKSSSEFSITTWVSWLGAQAIAFIYAISVGAYAYMAASAAWVAFYALMVVLIIKYRPRSKKEPLLLEASIKKENPGRAIKRYQLSNKNAIL